MASSYIFTTCTAHPDSVVTRLTPSSSQRKGFVIPCKVEMNQISGALKTRNLDEPLFKHGTNLIRKYSCPATKSEPGIALPSSVSNTLDIISSFIRPYAMIATVLTIASTSLLPLETMADLSPTFFIGVVQAIIAMLLMNLYNVAVNQLYDIEIDKVNKPYLPIAAGGLSMKIGAAITIATSFMSILMALMLQSPPLLGAVLTIFLFGGAYSINLPYLRWKKNSILAVVCLASWGLAFQIGTFFHIQKYVLGKPMVFTNSMIFAIIFQCIFSVVVALLKDLPDLEGDKANGCENMTVRFGKEKVFWGCTTLMLTTYGATTLMGASSPHLYSKIITVLGHSALAVIVWLRAQQVDLSDDDSTQSYYMLIWKLSGVESFLIPFVR